MGLQTNVLSRRSDGGGVTLARGLGWFSIGLGLTELLAPRALARLIGVRDSGRTRATMRAFGAREVAAGVAMLAMPRRPEPAWGRVIGDAIDLAALGWSLRSRRTDGERVALAIGAVVGVTALDVLAGVRLQTESSAASKPVTATITVNWRPVEVYAFWRSFELLPRFMENLASVRVIDERLSHWVAKTPAGVTAEWDAEIVEDRPGERIAWRSVEGADVDHHGSVTFRLAPDGRGTEVRVEMQTGSRRGGIVGNFASVVAKLFAGPEIAGDLRRFKQVLETGEVVRSDASIHPGMHPARPSDGKGLVLS